MKSLNTLMRHILSELGDVCCVNTELDQKTIESRIESEGWSFLTITLADFGKRFERCLETEVVDPDSFPGFRYRAGLPAFLGGFLGLIFDSKTGVILPEPDSTAVWAVRQLTLMWSKIKNETSEKRTRKALLDYVQTEQNVNYVQSLLKEDFQKESDFRRMAVLLFGQTLSDVARKIDMDEFRPQHGPGATADRLRGNAKWNQNEWTQRLERYFPHGEYLFNAWGHDHHAYPCTVNILEPGQERPVRIVAVPKTQKTPRIIAIEPTCMMYVQQGLLQLIQESIERDDILRHFIRFRDQTPNQRLAQQGSRSEIHRVYASKEAKGTRLATLDLSEASDRVSLWHVQQLCYRHTYFYNVLMAARSSKARIEELDLTIELSKFASMGSALTFPMEMMVFLTVIFLGLEKAAGTEFHARDIRRMRGLVAVYGDDIIVPADDASTVADHLEAFGFKVNRGKSFWNGKFRESCGKEYYDGTDVSIVRVRRELISDRGSSPEGIVSMVELRNQLYKAGLWSTVRWMDTVLEGVIPFPPLHLPLQH